MRIPKCFTLLAVAMSPLLAGFSQTVNPSTAPQANAPATLPSSADEVVRLANVTKFLTQTPKHAKRYHFFADPQTTNKHYSSRDQEEFQPPGVQLFSIRF